MVTAVTDPGALHTNDPNSLPTMLLHLAETRQTGAIVAKHGEEAAVIYLREGKIIGGSAPWTVSAEPLAMLDVVTRTIQQVIAWDECELRFHARVQPRRQYLTAGIDVGQALHGYRVTSTSPVESAVAEQGPAPAVEAELAEALHRLPSLVLWATVKYPNRPHLALMEAIQIALQRLLSQHEAFHGSSSHGSSADSPPEQPADEARARVSERHLELSLSEIHRSLQRRFPALEATQVADGQIDLTDLHETYELLTGPARTVFYTEVVRGLLTLTGQVVDNLARCLLHRQAPSAQTLSGWRAFVDEVERRLEAAAT